MSCFMILLWPESDYKNPALSKQLHLKINMRVGHVLLICQLLNTFYINIFTYPPGSAGELVVGAVPHHKDFLSLL